MIILKRYQIGTEVIGNGWEITRNGERNKAGLSLGDFPRIHLV